MRKIEDVANVKVDVGHSSFKIRKHAFHHLSYFIKYEDGGGINYFSMKELRFKNEQCHSC